MTTQLRSNSNNRFVTQHLDRLRASISPSEIGSDGDWIQAHTWLKGQLFSFKGHEYQKTIMDSPARVKVIIKPSQIGISELTIRLVLAFILRQMGVTAIYTLPTSSFAQKFSKTRFDVVVDESPDVKMQLHAGTDSSAVKRFGTSFVYFNGASRSGQVISVPSDLNCIDEYDFMENPRIVSQLNSRLTHSSHKKKVFLSTPTAPGLGISGEYENSMKHVEFTKCHRCNHQFLPDYYKDVVIPGFKADIATINYLNRQVLDGLDLSGAHLSCPKCHRPVDTDIKYREFVVENPDAGREAHGFQVTPFSCPTTRTIPDVINDAVVYTSVSDFNNFALGLPYESSETQLSRADIDKAFEPSVLYPEEAPISIMGLDLGGECACLTAGVFPNNHIRIYSAEMIPLHKVNTRYSAIAARRRVIASVIDIMPYTEVVRAIQNVDPNAFACIFSSAKGTTELFTVKEKEEDQTKATFGVRQISAKRDDGLDLVVSMIKGGQISFAPSCHDERTKITEHLLDLKKVRKTNRMGDADFTYKKSKNGTDHYFFALLYTVLASYLRGVSLGAVQLPFIVSGLKVKKEV